MDKSLEDRIGLLEIEVAGLSEREQFRLDQGTKDLSIETRTVARSMACRSILGELALHAGISAERYNSILEERTRFYHDSLLQTDDATMKNVVGRVDDRTLDEIPTERGYRPLFDAQNGKDDK